METIDFQQRVNRKIQLNKTYSDFPKAEDYGITESELSDYLFDKQAILDSEGSPRSQYTVAGILIVLPVIVISAFSEKDLPWGRWSLFVGLGIGLALAGCVKYLIKLLIRIRLKRMINTKIDDYIHAVLNYQSK
ncbi:MAG: hypothetical protein ACFNP5_05320 [Hoylesella saccharolytica]